MDKFDREIQKQLLAALYEATPNDIDEEKFNELQIAFGSEDNMIANLFYLSQHGLISNCITCDLSGWDINLSKLFITHHGVDFLRDDGGLGAILRIQTIRFHDDTLDELERLIKASSTATSEDKNKLISQLRSLPADAIKHLTIRLLGQGLDHLPDVFHVIQTAIQH
ncbi:hypothetical protein YS65_000455 [Salmonella enterica subsp. enterica]|nr:hypothetical protein [Salmonella enterica]EBS2904884.1 hypothetical protein [Salmonella enterica subsp. enterica serovar Flottbek]EDP8831184.1 hypothetical protein [Salmonella enterica subsp. enterica]EEE4100546.1 hypothetical protein [Salmonella enterica subsp. enterica serovar Enteritidis]HCM6247123.1 hypothetical protein [Salmonella enterica subsp. enterica serovar 45:b:-]